MEDCCAVDKFIYKNLVPPLKRGAIYNNLTPNDVTTISVVLRVLFVHFYLKRRIPECLACYVLAWVLDYVDGNLARDTGMSTSVGDYYDHISDNLFVIVGFGLLAHSLLRVERNTKQRLVNGVLMAGLFVVSAVLVPVNIYRHKVIENEPIEGVMKLGRWVNIGPGLCLGSAIIIWCVLIYLGIRTEICNEDKSGRPDLFR